MLPNNKVLPYWPAIAYFPPGELRCICAAVVLQTTTDASTGLLTLYVGGPVIIITVNIHCEAA